MELSHVGPTNQHIRTTQVTVLIMEVVRETRLTVVVSAPRLSLRRLATVILTGGVGMIFDSPRRLSRLLTMQTRLLSTITDPNMPPQLNTLKLLRNL